MQNKPNRCGIKMCGRAEALGFLHHNYQDALSSDRKERREIGKRLGYDVVMKLTETLPQKPNFNVIADNFFSTDILFQSLLPRGMYSTETIRTNRLKDCPLPDEK